MTPDVNCRVIDMPVSIPAFVVSNADGTFTIMLNARHSYEQHLKSYHHEMQHIANNDYERTSADLIEIFTHGLK